MWSDAVWATDILLRSRCPLLLFLFLPHATTCFLVSLIKEPHTSPTTLLSMSPLCLPRAVRSLRAVRLPLPLSYPCCVPSTCRHPCSVPVACCPPTAVPVLVLSATGSPDGLAVTLSYDPTGSTGHCGVFGRGPMASAMRNFIR